MMPTTAPASSTIGTHPQSRFRITRAASCAVWLGRQHSGSLVMMSRALIYSPISQTALTIDIAGAVPISERGAAMASTELKLGAGSFQLVAGSFFTSGP
jgi:hypothetical protein